MVFTIILVAIVTHVRRITYMPDLKLTLYYCVSWCTHISHNSVNGNRSCYRKTRSTDNVHTEADANVIANIVLFCATWYANKVNVRGAHCK